MQTITVTIPKHTTTAHGFGREASECTRVEPGTPGSFEIPVWIRKGERVPAVGETVATYRDGSTMYAIGTPRDR
jgi:hypothetical protein